MIPTELRERRQWVVWRYERRDGKPTKVPYQARPPRDRGAGGVQRAFRASATDPSTWRSFEEAVHVARGGFDGIGYVFTEHDPFAGIDLDECIQDGELHPAASSIVDALGSYTERSVSRSGVHVIVRAGMNGHGRHRTSNTPWGGEIEMYDRARFFTMSGNQLEDTPDTVEERQREFEELLAEWLPNPAAAAAPKSTNMDLVADSEVLARAFGAKNGAKVAALYRGDRAGYPSESEADLALCSLLAFWTGPDPDQLDRLFRGSELMREKWERQDYRDRTIAKALEGAEFADGDKPEPPRVNIGLIEGGAPRPKASAEPVDGAELLDMVAGFIANYVVLPSPAAGDLLALWVLHTHAIEAAFATPYVRIVSATPECGKSLLMEILAVLTRRGWYAVNPSVAVLYRKIARDQPTLFLDEMDNYPLDERRDALAVLNAGYKRGARVPRCTESGELQEFDVYCAKAYAGIDERQLVDTLLSRSITIRLEKRLASEPVEMWLPQDCEPQAAPLRERCEQWAAQHVDELRTYRPTLPDGMVNRRAEVWWALLAIAEQVGGAWPDRARAAAQELSSGGDDSDSVPDQVRLLMDIREAFGDAETISTATLLARLNDIEESPWGARRRGEGLDARGLARALRPFKVKSRTVRVADKTAKGYHLDQFEEAFARHLPEGSQASQGSQPASGLERDVTGCDGCDG